MGATYLGSYFAMPSAIDLAKRALVGILRTLAASYGVALSLKRDATDPEVSGAYQKVSRRVHPDRGGNTEDQAALNNAHDAWEAAKRARKPRGKHEREQKPEGAPAPLVRWRLVGKQNFVQAQLAGWKARFWCATLETNQDGTHHLHLMLQFFRAQKRNTETFALEGVRPNGRPNDLLGEGWGGRRLQSSLDRGFFYAWAEKEGTVRLGDGDLCVAGNYEPAWTSAKVTYALSARWLDPSARGGWTNCSRLTSCPSVSTRST